ncbi:LysR substrate-binding domain-containing protein [Bradyrhizobium sp. BWA-3-5]|uniref:LysR substrate-binding domain-containing protein n=1 Tax=Bradyrhizobium sp. BWA-3-5 TaxID=3080013 RepID=UPI00397CC2F0
MLGLTSPTSRAIIQAQILRNQIKPSPKLEIDSLNIMRTALGAGLGCGILPRSTVGSELLKSEIHARRIVEPNLTREFSLVSLAEHRLELLQHLERRLGTHVDVIDRSLPRRLRLPGNDGVDDRLDLDRILLQPFGLRQHDRMEIAEPRPGYGHEALDDAVARRTLGLGVGNLLRDDPGGEALRRQPEVVVLARLVRVRATTGPWLGMLSTMPSASSCRRASRRSAARFAD